MSVQAEPVARVVADERAAPVDAPLSALDAGYWLANRQNIIDAVECAGFEIVSNRDLLSNRDRFWLRRISPADERAAFEALRSLVDVLRERHYGRMPDAVQTAYDKAAEVVRATPPAPAIAQPAGGESSRDARMRQALARLDTEGPLPGMIAAFESCFGAPWHDRAYRCDTATWAMAWRMSIARTAILSSPCKCT